MAMMVREKRLALVAKMESREGKNTYTQSTRRSRVDSGYSDCSSLVHWVYKEVLGINIGDDTVGQIRTKKLTTIDAGIRDGIPDEKKLLPGDLLFFRGSDTGRKSADYVGHVEMYVGKWRTVRPRLRNRTCPEEYGGILQGEKRTQRTCADQ